MVNIMEKPMNKWMIWGYPYFWKHPFEFHGAYGIGFWMMKVPFLFLGGGFEGTAYFQGLWLLVSGILIIWICSRYAPQMGSNHQVMCFTVGAQRLADWTGHILFRNDTGRNPGNPARCWWNLLADLFGNSTSI